MKKIFVAFLLGTALLSGGVKADEHGYISVSTQIVREVQPDFAEFNVSVETRNVNKDVAVQENNKTAEAIVQALKPLVGADGIKSERYSVNPQYRWEKSKQIFENYYVNSTYSVKTRDLDRVPELINLALSNGATSTNGLRFSLKDKAKYYDAMYKEATLENQRKASNVAEALGRKLGAPKSISLSPVSRDSVYPSPRVMKMMSAGAEANDAAVLAPVEEGLVKIDVTVDSKFYIK